MLALDVITCMLADTEKIRCKLQKDFEDRSDKADGSGGRLLDGVVSDAQLDQMLSKLAAAAEGATGKERRLSVVTSKNPYLSKRRHCYSQFVDVTVSRRAEGLPEEGSYHNVLASMRKSLELLTAASACI